MGVEAVPKLNCVRALILLGSMKLPISLIVFSILSFNVVVVLFVTFERVFVPLETFEALFGPPCKKSLGFVVTSFLSFVMPSWVIEVCNEFYPACAFCGFRDRVLPGLLLTCFEVLTVLRKGDYAIDSACLLIVTEMIASLSSSSFESLIFSGDSLHVIPYALVLL